jgi:hypothetical protein
MILGKYELAAGPLGVMNLAILLREVRGGDLVCSPFVGGTSTANWSRREIANANICLCLDTRSVPRGSPCRRLKAESWIPTVRFSSRGPNPIRVE